MMRGSLRFAIRCRSSILMARSRFMVPFSNYRGSTLTRLAALATLSRDAGERLQGHNSKLLSRIGALGERGTQTDRAGWVWGTPSDVARPVVAPQEVGAELIEARTADLAHDQVDLFDEDVDRPFDTGQPAGGGTVERRPAHEAEIGAKTQRDQDIGAAANAAVEE